MEIEGTVHRVLPVVKGTSARGEWQKQEIVVEMMSEFNRKVCISFWGDKVQDVATLREGDPVKVSINIESREYNGRWFTEVRAWRIQKNQPEQAGAPGDMPPFGVSEYEAPASSSSADVDDLPF